MLAGAEDVPTPSTSLTVRATSQGVAHARRVGNCIMWRSGIACLVDKHSAVILMKCNEPAARHRSGMCDRISRGRRLRSDRAENFICSLSRASVPCWVVLAALAN